MMTILEESGWETVWTETGDRAMEEVGRRLPDLILLDYELPGMRGDELCRRIRMSVATRGVPILMLTAGESDISEARGLESGADDYVSKSADPEMLVLRIRSLMKKSTAAATILGPPEAQFRRARLLAIDDSPTYLESLASDLSRDGYTVEKALSGEEGLRRLSNEAFDCVLVDLMMPGIDGIEVCRQIGEMRRRLRRHIAVLILTAHESKEEMSRSLEIGADDFVGKSTDSAVLKSRIRALLRRNYFQEENERILEELKNRELEAIRAKAENEAAQAKAAVAEKLERTVEDLRRSREEVLQLNRELDRRIAEVEAANRELEAFSYSVSHDLRAPLRAIDGFSKILLESSVGKLDEAEKRQFERIRAGSQRMGQLIDDLLSLSRVARSEMRRTQVDLSALAATIAADLQKSQPARRVEFVIAPGMVV
jgi:two-component system NtrC family sensor kinase